MRPTGLDVPDRGGEDRSVIDLLRNVVAAVARFFAPRAVVVAENLLLRHQLIVLRRSTPRPRLRRLDRWLIATLATRARSLLEAVMSCGLRRFSGGIERHGGCGGATARAVGSAGRRSTASCEISSDACGGRTACGARTVSPASSRSSAGASRRARSRSTVRSTWAVAAVNTGGPFSGTTPRRFGPATSSGRHRSLPYALCVRRRLPRAPPDRPRRVTAHPTGAWVAQRMIEAVGDAPSRFLLRDRDSIYDARFRRRLRGLGVRGLLSPPRAPLANASASWGRSVETASITYWSSANDTPSASCASTSATTTAGRIAACAPSRPQAHAGSRRDEQRRPVS